MNRLWHSWESFRDELKRHLRESEEWQAFLTDLQRAAEAVIAAAVPSTRPAGKPEAQLLSDARATRRRAVVEPLLKAKGLTRAGLALKAGVDPSVLYDYMNGKRSLRPVNRNLLAEPSGIAESGLPE